jgi:ABC-2 type transport system permease protein
VSAFSWTAISVLWLREMKRFVRARSRLVGTLVMPLLLFLFFGMGLSRLLRSDALAGISYESFLLPGIIGMSILLSSTFAGISVLWDREFGFLKEIMVAPVSRLSIVLGRIAGGVTTSLLQVVIILAVAAPAGFRPTTGLMLAAALALAAVTSIGFIALGLAFASNMRDMQGFNLVMSFVILPVFLFSGALFPLSGSAPLLRALSYLDPLTYAVDGLRACLIGQAVFPLALDFAVTTGFAATTVLLGAFFFERYEGA